MAESGVLRVCCCCCCPPLRVAVRRYVWHVAVHRCRCIWHVAVAVAYHITYRISHIAVAVAYRTSHIIYHLSHIPYPISHIATASDTRGNAPTSEGEAQRRAPRLRHRSRLGYGYGYGCGCGCETTVYIVCIGAASEAGAHGSCEARGSRLNAQGSRLETRDSWLRHLTLLNARMPEALNTKYLNFG